MGLCVMTSVNIAETEPLGGAQHGESSPGYELREALFGPAIMHHYPFT